MKAKKGVRSNRKRRSILLRAALVAFLLYAAFTLFQMQMELRKQRTEAAVISDEIEKTKVKREETQYQLDHIDEYREQLARQNGYGNPGEIVFKETPGMAGE